MKVFVDSDLILELNEIKKKVIQNDVNSEIFLDDMKRRLVYIIMHKYEKCFEALKNEWDSKLAARGVESIPLDQDKYAELVFSQKDYENRSLRDKKELK